MPSRPSLPSFLKEARPARLLRLAYIKAAREIDRRTAKAQTLNLALQGGGALGAFTWGVLDRLSHERSLRIGAISGASAGALNAALFVSGLVRGGGPGAREALQSFWSDVADAAAAASFIFPPMFSAQTEIWRQAFGDAGAFAVNPLRAILEKHVDIEALRAPEAPALFVSATHVTTAKPRIFANAEMSVDVLLASACLPNIHPAVWIDGEPYWDGGFSANPALAPLAGHEADRTLLVRLIASGAETPPKSGKDVDAYLKNYMFSRPLDDELARLKDFPDLDVISLGDYAPDARLDSRPSASFVKGLFAKGRDAAEDYLGRAGDSPMLRKEEPGAKVRRTRA
jgi:NTE family protein